MDLILFPIGMRKFAKSRSALKLKYVSSRRPSASAAPKEMQYASRPRFNKSSAARDAKLKMLAVPWIPDINPPSTFIIGAMIIIAMAALLSVLSWRPSWVALATSKLIR